MATELIAKYRKLFNTHCWGHELYDLPTLHLILGQLPEVRKIKVYYQSDTHYIDLRFHFCYMSPTGTGKGAGANFIKNICDLVGLNMQTITTATDAGLIGQPHRVLAYNPKTKSMENIVMVEKGLLHPDKNINILLYPEASTLFKENMSSYVQERADYFQITMNPLGTNDNKLVKKLAIDYTIEFNPCCSLFFTTYEPEGLFSTLVNRGLLQRMFFIVNQIDDKTRMKMVEEAVLKITDLEGAQMRKDIEEKKLEIANDLKRVNEFAKGVVEMRKNSDINEAFKALIKLMLNSIEDCAPTVREQMYKFLQRYFEIGYKIAVHHALMRLDNTVTQEDVLYSKELMLSSWKRLQSLMEMRYIPGSSSAKRLLLHDKVIVEKLGEMEMPIHQNKLKRLIQDTFGYSLIATMNYIKQLETKGYIRRIEGTPNYELTGKKVILI